MHKLVDQIKHSIQETSQHHPHLENLLIIIRPNLLQMRLHLRIVAAHMLTIPAITPTVVIGEGRLQALERYISTAHDSLTHVVEAVDHVPVVVLGQTDVALQPGVDLDDGVQAVQLVRHASGEDCLVLVPYDGCWQVVVQLRPLDVLEAHADRDQVVPGLECLRLEEVGGVVWREGLVDLECRDFGRDWDGLVGEVSV